MASPAYNPLAQQVFDLSREFILSYATPTVLVSDRSTNSTTQSTYRLRWNTIHIWENFGTLVTTYWNAVPQTDKQQFVYTQNAYSDRYQILSSGLSRAANEGDVKSLVNEFVTPVHWAAANGLNGAARPVDQHSRFQRWEQGVEANQLAGIPDFVLTTEHGHPRRITAVVEVKNRWQVNPGGVDHVIQSTHLHGFPH